MIYNPFSITVPEYWPEIRRARDFFLYDRKGERYWDLYLNCGRAYLGHRPGKLSHTIKDSISKGCWAPYPSSYLKKFIKKISNLVPGYKGVRIYNNFERLTAICGIEHNPADPALGESDPQVEWWRPELPSNPKGEFLLPLLPFPGGVEYQAVLFKSDDVAGESLPASDSISSVFSEAMIRLLDDLVNSFAETSDSIPVVLDMLPESDDWSLRGRYLSFSGSEDSYSAMVNEALKLKILLPPTQKTPMILPDSLSSSMEKGLKKVFTEVR